MTVASKAATTAATSLRSVAHRIVSPATALPILSGRSSQSAGFHSSSSTLASGKGKSQINTISVDPRILDGTAGFLPKENVDRLVEWQSGLWQRLAGEVKNNPNLLPIKEKWQSTGLDMTNLLYFTARDPSLTLAFNYASALINNSYFLESINPSDEQSIPSFAEPNAQALKDKVEAYAEGIVGGGCLWLVRSGVSNTDLDILPTFGAGTLLITQRAQIGREDVPLFGTPSTPNYNPSPRLSPNSASSKPAPSPPSTTDASSSAGSSPPLNETAAQAAEKQTQQERQHRDSRSPILPVPLAVLNLHEMAWLGKKYGVWDRRRYAGDWFRSLDWSRVAQRAK